MNEIYGIVDTDKKVYVCSELVKGIELQKYVLTKGILGERQAVHFASHTAKVMLSYWEKGLAYIDLRCEKIIITGDAGAKDKGVDGEGFVCYKMIDNGNSIACDDHIIQPSIYASICPKDTSYLPPDVSTIGFTKYTHVYSIGVMLYFILTGVLPNVQKVKLPDRISALVASMMDNDISKRMKLEDVADIHI